MSKLHIDHINQVDLDAAMVAGFGAIDSLQNHKPGPQVVGIAMVFSQLMQAYGLAPTRVLEVVSRIEQHASQTGSPHIRAIRQYIEEEVVK